MDNGHMYCEYRMKGMFVSAIKVGAGLIIGKAIGRGLLRFMDKSSGKLLVYLANRGVPQAIQICNECNIQYDKEAKSDQFRDKIIGFRVE